MKSVIFIIFICILGLFGASCDYFVSKRTSSISKQLTFTYQIKLPYIKGKKIAIWVPYPFEDKFQKILKTDIRSPFKWEINQEKKYGNRMIYFHGQSLAKINSIQIKYKILRKPADGLNLLEIQKNVYDDPSRYLGPNTLLPNIKLFSDIAHKQIGGLSDKKKISKVLYHFVVDSMQYDKSGKGWGNGDPIWACSNKRGNCTDFHSLYIALIRSQKIPARFHIGFPISSKKSSEIKGYHCWAEVFDSEYGWKPLDATEGKKSGKANEYYGRLPANRIHFSTGRDIELVPRQKQKPLNYFIYPYIEVDGNIYKNYKAKFSYKLLPIQ